MLNSKIIFNLLTLNLRGSSIGNRFFNLLCLIGWSVLFTTWPVPTIAEPIQLSLSGAITIALKENKIINYYYIGNEIAYRRVDFEKAIYIPNLNLTGLTERYRWDSLTLDNYHKQAVDQYQISLSKKNPLGGTSSINFSTEKEGYVYNIPRINRKEYTSSIFLKYEQPLLKGFGRNMTNFNIDKAKMNKELAFQKSEDMKSNILYNVFRDYFLFYRATEELRLAREIRKNTGEIFNVVKEKVEMRRLPITDLNKMEAWLYTQDKEILELAFKRWQRQNQLMLSIYNDARGDSFKEMVLLTTPDDVIRDYKESPSLETKMKTENNDFELLQFKNDLKLYGKDMQKALNDMKPDLTLSMELGTDGYDFNRRSKSISDINSDNYRGILQGILSLPIINTAAKSKWLEVKGQVVQTNIQISNRRNIIENSVNEIYNDIEMVRKKKELNDKIVAISKQNLENEIEKLVRDKSTVLNTLDYQTNLLRAELDLLTTKVDYMLILGTTYLYRREMEVFANGLK